MKFSVIIAAIATFATASLVEAEMPALRRAEEASTNVAMAKDNDCDQFGLCNGKHTPPPRMLNDATSQEKHAEKATTDVKPTGNDDDDHCMPASSFNCQPNGPPARG